MKRGIRRDTVAAANALLIILVGVLMVSASSVAILLYDTGQSSRSPDVVTAERGDTVRVDYVGRLPDERVFDTSQWKVASDDALYPKSLNFDQGNQSDYRPLEFQIGDGKMIQGFENGVIGMKENQTKELEIPPSQGYGEMNQSKLVERSYRQSIPVFEDMTFAQYAEEFSTSPVVGQTLQDPMWKWDVTVLSANRDADLVRVFNSPELNQEYPVFGQGSGEDTGWNIKVTSFDSSADQGQGEIVIRHMVDPEDGRHLKGIDMEGEEFILEEVDPESNTLVLNYNREVVGVTLTFTVTLVEIV
ncbi:MAG: FKBP-type peptidyl-prolyl cis-trans isomerase [Methanomassiliicoccales archaeon]